MIHSEIKHFASLLSLSFDDDAVKKTHNFFLRCSHIRKFDSLKTTDWISMKFNLSIYMCTDRLCCVVPIFVKKKIQKKTYYNTNLSKLDPLDKMFISDQMIKLDLYKHMF